MYPEGSRATSSAVISDVISCAFRRASSFNTSFSLRFRTAVLPETFSSLRDLRKLVERKLEYEEGLEAR